MNHLHPDNWFDPPPGTDRHLATRTRIREWLVAMAEAYTSMEHRVIGTSTEGRPIDAVYIGDRLANTALETIEGERAAAVDHLLNGEAPAEPQYPVLLVTSGIHATEVGGPQSIPHIVHWLATSNEAANIRERCLTIIVPSLNPDGFDLVSRWHQLTLGTPQAGSLPPLLYHRFAGHDNNRDWLFRNLRETRVILDEIHGRWLPHITLDQHQMQQHGPRFAMPPYADPWEPHIHPDIVAASNAIGQAIAADMSLGGLSGVMTGRYFDAWEPSRALQHYRGGIRILAEAASANLAHPIEITRAQLDAGPLPQPTSPTASSPSPWQPGRWGLSDIVRYHVAAAKSMLSRANHDTDRWPAIQQAALCEPPSKSLFFVPEGRDTIDPAANTKLCKMLRAATRSLRDSSKQSFRGPLAEALLVPKPYPEEHGNTAYDITTHMLPLFMGATVSPKRQADEAALSNATTVGSDRSLAVVDARCHAAPELVEPLVTSDPPMAWRVRKRAIAEGTLIEPGSWIIARNVHPERSAVDRYARATIGMLPAGAVPVARRNIVVLDIAVRPSEDLGWTRWWFQTRGIPFLDVHGAHAPDVASIASSMTVVVPDAGSGEIDDDATALIETLLRDGAQVIAWGASGRHLASQLSPSVSSPDMSRDRQFRAPGALLRLSVKQGTALATGLDRSIPALYQRDGVFRIDRSAREVEVLARFAAHETVVSGWLSRPSAVAGAPAILRINRGDGALIAFSFRPLFRGQMLASSPLVHNLLYAIPENAPCPH